MMRQKTAFRPLHETACPAAAQIESPLHQRKLLKIHGKFPECSAGGSRHSAGIDRASVWLGALRLVGGVVRFLKNTRPIHWGLLALALAVPVLGTLGQAQEETSRKVK